MAKPSRGGKVYARREQASKPAPEMRTGKRVGIRDIESYMDSHKAGPSVISERTVKVGGVDFTYTADGKNVNSKGEKEYWMEFQSNQRADDGTYPSIHFSVLEKRRRGAKYYSWNRSAASGTRFV